MEKRESETIEFKKSTSELKEAIISLSSMLNKTGYGTVYFGIKNDGSIYGQEIGKNIKYEYRNNQFGFTFEFSRQNNNFSNNDLKEVESLKIH